MVYILMFFFRFYREFPMWKKKVQWRKTSMVVSNRLNCFQRPWKHHYLHSPVLNLQFSCRLHRSRVSFNLTSTFNSSRTDICTGTCTINITSLSMSLKIFMVIKWVAVRLVLIVICDVQPTALFLSCRYAYLVLWCWMSASLSELASLLRRSI